jgi:hypothetical protein
MAIELLVKRMKLRHAPHHDLESLFFVLIYICTNLSGPGAIRTQEELRQFSSIPLSSWFQTSNSLRAIGIAKLGAMCELDSVILRFFAPYFEDLKECVGKLLKAMYSSPGTPAPVSHDVVIKIFDETLQSLPREPIISVPFEPLSAGSPSRVRKLSLGIHDNHLGRMQKKFKSSGGNTLAGHMSSSTGGADLSNSVASHDTVATSSRGGGRRACGSRSRQPVSHSH